MVNVTRSAKSGNDWTTQELIAYNIMVNRQDPLPFFGRKLLSIDHLDSNLFSTADPNTIPDVSKETYCFLAYLDRAMRANSGQESAINDLARSVLEVTGFEKNGAILCTCYGIRFTICSDANRTAKTDICLINRNSMILLVVHEDIGTKDPEPKVIADAIATFQHNNRKRREMGLDPIDAMTIPCITVIGTRPTFYMVPVTTQLSQSIITGQYPERTTVVTRCAPPSRVFEGMEVPDYRRAALQYYTTFREQAKVCWSTFIEGSM
ncbi:hypothetical protein BD410DRAFT_317814 [Rickenella mellea]|uniref:Fungal-type protein kinase domain-containing protein n=1 Tax=Rickenella mellea TaxID=50990 RepID=A0A4Y7Q1Z6_9AGAM|nr:hypothetical protein BD410DRAFT_317814 [Rickenella mellea]